ncbi:MAG: Lin0512 family protein [Hyphomicrobiales bacterium]
MALKRIILEMGHGNDMHGGDYTKAALRAVQDAIHHSALPFLRTLKIDPRQLQITVTIGVQKPDAVDAEAVRKSLPVGTVTVQVKKGGLDVPDVERGGNSVIATAAIEVRADMATARNTA